MSFVERGGTGMAQINMENLTKEARMTYISADFIEQTEE